MQILRGAGAAREGHGACRRPDGRWCGTCWAWRFICRAQGTDRCAPCAGTPIKLAVTVDRKDGSAVFDFEGTGPEVFGNTNAPPAVTYSAIIYSLRCMVRQEIPLNQVLPCWPPSD